jgi:hypothetical protein
MNQTLHNSQLPDKAREVGEEIWGQWMRGLNMESRRTFPTRRKILATILIRAQAADLI